MLKRLFGKGTFLDPDVEGWHLETWTLLLQRLGAQVSLAETPVVLPTREFFPPTEATGHSRAEHVFACVKSVMGMEAWPVSLEAQTERRGGERIAEFVSTESVDAPAGTFRVEGDGRVVITYSPELVDRPGDLVATLAHELAHYLLASHQELVEDETHELMTDLAVAYAGLGLFGANAAFSFGQHGDAFSQGWSWRSSGYLSPRSWAFALAVFARLRGDDGGIEPYLKPEIASLRRDALRYLDKHPDLLAPLRPA